MPPMARQAYYARTRLGQAKGRVMMAEREIERNKAALVYLQKRLEAAKKTAGEAEKVATEATAAAEAGREEVASARRRNRSAD